MNVTFRQPIETERTLIMQHPKPVALTFHLQMHRLQCTVGETHSAWCTGNVGAGADGWGCGETEFGGDLESKKCRIYENAIKYKVDVMSLLFGRKIVLNIFI